MQTQVLGEAVDLTGTPFQLHYSSRRTPGRKASYTLQIPLSDASLPASVKRIKLEVSVAGQRFTHSYIRLAARSRVLLPREGVIPIAGAGL